MTSPTPLDGDLPTARKHLGDAIHALAGRTRTTINRDPNPDIREELDHQHAANIDRINNHADTAIERLNRINADPNGTITQTINDERTHKLHNAQQRHEEQVVALTTHIDWNDSLYTQLHTMLGGAQGTQLGNTARSMPPLWIDATDLLNTIDRGIATIDNGPGDTTTRLHRIADRTWRPQDVTTIETLTAQLWRWTHAIQELLNPTPRKALPNPCPNCSTSVVYRKDSAGDTIRQPALQIGTHGCECQHCHTIWAPEYFRHLANVLGYALPEGVLE
ncbi:hypothetical protein [Gordonia sp. ABSL49_1]|uniref:DUF7340 domain-containing protein n=1 Tax=Gordonia sp. ABSL49_1 TaxID=2920941 RepID=UPI001F118283|nr:hypothetical protein [Gordonia sp. ABSL49_1]MCH5645146.1 hypothetical protein [Gordonia sp. ABSL49_1]